MNNNVFDFSSGYRVFSSYWWRRWFRIRTYTRPFKYSYQRITRGWADSDTWNIDTWHSIIMSESIEYLRTHNNGYPEGLTEEKWDEILSDIANGFKIAIDKDSIPDEYVKVLETSTGWRAELGIKDREYDWEKIDALQKDKIEKLYRSLDLMKKYYFSLWD